MHVTLLGAGALGRIYGLRLLAASDEVAFVVRPARAMETSPFVIEQVNGGQRRDVAEQPRRVTAVPAETRVVLLPIRFDQIALNETAALLRAAPSVPIVVLTPLLPRQQAALEAARTCSSPALRSRVASRPRRCASPSTTSAPSSTSSTWRWARRSASSAAITIRRCPRSSDGWSTCESAAARRSREVVVAICLTPRARAPTLEA